MTLEQISYLSQTIGAVAVVASLIFVGVQIRQSDKTQRALMHDNRLRVMRETMLHISSPGVTDSFIKGSNADPEISQTEFTQYFLLTLVQDLTRNDQYSQYRDGLISAERWNQSKATIVAMMTAPGYRAMYPLHRALFTSDYQALLDGIMKETVPFDQAKRMEIWKSLAQTESARIAAPAAGTKDAV